MAERKSRIMWHFDRPRQLLRTSRRRRGAATRALTPVIAQLRVVLTEADRTGARAFLGTRKKQEVCAPVRTTGRQRRRPRLQPLLGYECRAR
jgi:hypothetical protein